MDTSTAGWAAAAHALIKAEYALFATLTGPDNELLDTDVDETRTAIMRATGKPQACVAKACSPTPHCATPA